MTSLESSKSCDSDIVGLDLPNRASDLLHQSLPLLVSFNFIIARAVVPNTITSRTNGCVLSHHSVGKVRRSDT